MTGLRAYAEQASDPREIAERVRSHMPLVRKVAWQIHGRVRDLFEIEDLIQIGMVTLVEAAQRFQDTGQASFSAYAAVRVRGALTDHLRKNLTLTRLGVQRRDKIVAAEKAVKAAGLDPTKPEVLAEHLGITVGELHSWRQKVAAAPNKSLDEVYDDHSVWFADEGHTPESAMVADELRGVEAVVIDPPRAGAEAQIDRLAATKVPVIAYVSCNPVTFARDAKVLVAAGYRLDWVQVVDQFRWSSHVELAARFAR